MTEKSTMEKRGEMLAQKWEPKLKENYKTCVHNNPGAMMKSERGKQGEGKISGQTVLSVDKLYVGMLG